MIAYKPNKIAEPEKLMKVKKKLDKIGNKYKPQIVKKIDDYCKKIGFSMFFDVVIDIKLVGKVKERGKKYDGEKKIY